MIHNSWFKQLAKLSKNKNKRDNLSTFTELALNKHETDTKPNFWNNFPSNSNILSQNHSYYYRIQCSFIIYIDTILPPLTLLCIFLDKYDMHY